MTLLARVLEVPSYGYLQNDSLYIPTKTELIREFGKRVNFLKDRRNWLAFFSWTATLVMAVPLAFFITQFFSWPLFVVGFIYSMVVLGTHGTVYYHRYGTHRAFQFSNPVWRFLVKHSVIKLIPEELYVVSHHVHHWISEKPGDPYNVNGGWLYCFLADAIHQPIRRDLSEQDYFKVKAMLSHTGIRMNSYQQYRKWGSVCHPLTTSINFILNWSTWYFLFYILGGHPLAVTMFASAGVWGIGIRTFNFDGHGGGKDKRKEGIDFYREDHSINQLWPGLITGEWHNNHHLYPNGARAGFLSYQFDSAWYVIKFLNEIGAITSYKDYREDFMQKHYLPYLASKSAPAAKHYA